jgi:precorrin-3B C17-methyltransferase
MAEYEIGMLTTVLIGNSSTFIKEGLMVTPRGYANKYEGITGSVKEGEQKGRSLSLGLDGWTASIKQAVEAGEDIEKLASNFDLSIEEIFLASSTINVYSDVSEGLEKLKLVIAEFGFMKSGQIQMPINPQDIEISPSQISLKKDLITAQIDVDTISSIWFIDQSVWLLNIDGRAMMSFHK